MQVAKIITIMALVVAATVAQQEVPEEFPLDPDQFDEMIPAFGEAEDLNLLESPAHANKRILNNIRNLIAFAQGAKEKAYDMTEGAVKVKVHSSPVVRIVLDLSKKSKIKNMVLRYVHDIEAAKADFPRGIGHYVLAHLHRAIINGKGAVKVSKEGDHMYAKLTHRALGLQVLPAYVDKMKVLHHKYASLVHAISLKGVEHALSASCLLKNKLRSYKSFLNDFKGVSASKIRKEHRKLTKSALKHIVHTKAVAVKAPSGVKGAKATLKKDGGVVVMAPAAMVKQAKKLARAWAKKNGHCERLSDFLNGNTGMAAAKKVTHNKKTAAKLSIKYKVKAAEVLSKFKKAQAAAKAKADAKAKAKAAADIKENAKKVARGKKIAALKKKLAAAKARQAEYEKKKAEAKTKQQEKLKKHQAEQAAKQRAKKKAAEKKAKAAKEQKEKREKALAEARALRDKKERAHKNRVVRKCTNHDTWANCTAHPISWYTNCDTRVAGTSRVTWRRCGFMSAGGQYLCRRHTCKMVKVRV